MTSLRHRTPFLAANDDDDERNQPVLDETEQDELIADLRQQNIQTTARARILLDTVLACATFLQFAYLLKDSKQSLLVPLFPPSVPDPDPPIPWPVAFTCLALVIHANLVLHVHPSVFKAALPQLPFSYSLMYALAAVAPTLSLFLARSWQTTLWAAAPAIVVGIIHSVHSTLQESDAALAELESLKYRAPGP